MKALIVPKSQKTESEIIEESDNVKFECPEHTVLVGRWHEGDENGDTQYLSAGLRILDDPFTEVDPSVRITVENHIWHKEENESRSSFIAKDNRVITGRRHEGDENGPTWYRTSIVLVDGFETRIINKSEMHPLKESSGHWFYASAYDVVVGRRHRGDENGLTWYTTANIAINIPNYISGSYVPPNETKTAKQIGE